jgi:hypothetical protein
VKPRVDSHWKKPVVTIKPTIAIKPTTRADTHRQIIPEQPVKSTSVAVKVNRKWPAILLFEQIAQSYMNFQIIFHCHTRNRFLVSKFHHLKL